MNENSAQAIAKNISRLRRESGLSQQRVAEELNVTRQAVSAWERGLSEPDARALTRLADLFNCGADELLRGRATAHASTKAAKTAKLCAALGAALLLALAVCEVVLESGLKQAYLRSFNGMPYYIYSIAVRQFLMWAGCGLLAFGCVSLARARIAKAAAIIMAAPGALAALAYAGIMTVYFSGVGVPSALIMPFLYVVSHPSLLGCAGALAGAGAAGLVKPRN